jgi:hypothetical protein
VLSSGIRTSTLQMAVLMHVIQSGSCKRSCAAGLTFCTYEVGLCEGRGSGVAGCYWMRLVVGKSLIYFLVLQCISLSIVLLWLGVLCIDSMAH